MKKNKYSGSNFDDFLKEEGIYEEVKTLAQKELAEARCKRYPKSNNDSEHVSEHDREGENEHN